MFGGHDEHSAARILLNLAREFINSVLSSRGVVHVEYVAFALIWWTQQVSNSLVVVVCSGTYIRGDAADRAVAKVAFAVRAHHGVVAEILNLRIFGTPRLFAQVVVHRSPNDSVVSVDRQEGGDFNGEHIARGEIFGVNRGDWANSRSKNEIGRRKV